MHCASSKTQLANLILQQNNYKDDGTIKLQIAPLRQLKNFSWNISDGES